MVQLRPVPPSWDSFYLAETFPEFFSEKVTDLLKHWHRVKYARILSLTRIFQHKDRIYDGFRTYARKYGSQKTHILRIVSPWKQRVIQKFDLTLCSPIAHIWEKVFKSRLKAVFHKFYLVHSWILCQIYVPNSVGTSLWSRNLKNGQEFRNVRREWASFSMIFAEF